VEEKKKKSARGRPRRIVTPEEIAQRRPKDVTVAPVLDGKRKRKPKSKDF